MNFLIVERCEQEEKIFINNIFTTYRNLLLKIYIQYDQFIKKMKYATVIILCVFGEHSKFIGEQKNLLNYDYDFGIVG